MANAETIDLIRATVEFIDKLLAMSTGLGSVARKLVAYYTLTTYTLPKCNIFPLLVLYGPLGTGKSEAARIIKAFAYKPHAMSLRGMSPPAFRDELAEAHEGTVIAEEGDTGWRAESKNYENLFSDRYHRDSTKIAKKISAGEYEWVTQERFCFGASVLHKRLKFADAALEGRSITVQFRANHNRKYTEFSESDPAVVELKKRIAKLAFDPPKSQRPFEAAGRILASYKPILAVAEMCGDIEFLDQVVTSLDSKSKQLAEDQAVEPDGLVLRAIVECLSHAGGLVFRNVKIKDIRASILHNFAVDLQPRQIAALARELGFHTKNSHGFTVVVPMPRTLLNACKATMYEDESIAALRKDLEKPESLAILEAMMNTNEDNRQRYLDINEVAALLGCSPRTIYTWCSQGAIPYRKAGRKLIFDEAEVRSWTKPQSNTHSSRTLTRR